ncbi:hypothetical protein WLY71_27880 [Pseudomonas sp. P2663]
MGLISVQSGRWGNAVPHALGYSPAPHLPSPHLPSAGFSAVSAWTWL